ncbi:unnamed protein product [Gongylonema pulchrum]|uniref:PAPA-1 domain-containing protein n=1 Tax=Gongylonema pulchrum TaxID=637853 RepID=A0A183EEF2_9BILA|nr:unnamed protein product [Gongylonema pulchrum]
MKRRTSASKSDEQAHPPEATDGPSDEYVNLADTTNAFVLPSKSKKRKKAKKTNDKAVNRKKEEARKRRLAQIEAKMSKTKRKKVDEIKREERDKAVDFTITSSVFLRDRQTFINLQCSSSAPPCIRKFCTEIERIRFEEEEATPRKLSNLAGRDFIPASELKPQPIQENYYETGSESSDEELQPDRVLRTNEEPAEHVTNEDEGPGTTIDSVLESRAELLNDTQTPSVAKNRDSATENNSSDQKLPSQESDVSEPAASTSTADIANAIPQKLRNSRSKDGKIICKTRFVPVHRSASVEARRSKLPIYSEEQAIMEAINDNCVSLP